jgi:hypothetical protein
MKNPFRSVLICIVLLALIPVITAAIYVIQRTFGYFPGGHFPTIAKYAAERGDVSLCHKIIALPWPTIGGPSVADARLSCIHDYASLTKDPAVCELLMPSEYGWACVGAAMEREPCVFVADAARTVKGQGIVTTYDACLTGPPVTKNHVCCAMARVVFEEENNVDDCSAFPTNSLRDQCHREMAIKEADISSCALIMNTNIRSACEVQVRALKYKQI